MFERLQKKLIVLEHRVHAAIENDEFLGGGQLSWAPQPESRLTITDSSGFVEELFSRRALHQYRVQDRLPNRRKLKELEDQARRLFPSISARDLTSERVGYFRFADKLGYSRRHARWVVDTTYSAHYPMFRSLAQTRGRASKFVEKFGGCYYLYRRDFDPALESKGYPLGALLRATLSIRYAVPSRAYTSSKVGQSRIRCKLNIPAYDSSGRTVYKYDGAVVPTKSKWWTWLFQGRFGESGREVEDIVLMYTHAFRRHDDNTTIGSMLTQNQDRNFTPTVSNVVLIRNMSFSNQVDEDGIPGNVPDETCFMRATEIVDLSRQETWSDWDRRALAKLQKVSARNGVFPLVETR